MHPPPTWHVLRTRPQAELAVAERLTAAGLVPLVPLARVWRPRFLGRQRRTEERAAPLLPSYAFLAAPVADWPAVLGTDDVWGVLVSDGRPAVVLDQELAELRRMAGLAPIRAGQRLAVDAGPFAGHDVTVLSVDEARRAIGAEVFVLGAARQVRLSVDVLAAA